MRDPPDMAPQDAAFSCLLDEQARQVVEYLREENRVLREQLRDQYGCRQVRLTDSQRRRLAGKGTGWRIRVEWLPAYAPELNPAEQIWNHAKYTDLANFVPDHIAHLARRIGLSFHYQSRDPHRLRSYFKTAKLRI